MKVHYSTVLDHSAESVWGMIRDFNSYPVWVDTVEESFIEDRKAGDAVGAIRNFLEAGARIRQRLLALSDVERSYTYESCDGYGAISYYRGTARVTPIVDGNRALVEWTIRFDAPPEQQEGCAAALREAMPRWMRSLDATLAGAA